MAQESAPSWKDTSYLAELGRAEQRSRHTHVRVEVKILQKTPNIWSVWAPRALTRGKHPEEEHGGLRL